MSLPGVCLHACVHICMCACMCMCMCAGSVTSAFTRTLEYDSSGTDLEWMPNGHLASVHGCYSEDCCAAHCLMRDACGGYV